MVKQAIATVKDTAQHSNNGFNDNSSRTRLERLVPAGFRSKMDMDMDISLFCRVSTMAALSTTKMLPFDSVNIEAMASIFPEADPINVPRNIRLRSEQDCSEAFHLLLTILHNPELGYYIRHIDILRDTSFHGHFKPTPVQRSISEEDGMLLRQAIRNCGWYDVDEEMVLNMLLQKHFDTDISNGFQSSRVRGGRHTRGSHIIQALAVLLMSVSPNLESIKLRPIGRYMKEGFSHLPLEQFLVRASNTIHHKNTPLKNLRRIDLLHTDDTLARDPILFNPYDLFYHMSLFDKLPSIEQICVGGMEIDEDGQEDLPPLSSNIQRIDLLHSVLPTMFLCSVIASSKRLQHFSHSVGGRATIDEGNWHMGFPAILRALLVHREWLECLDLDTDFDYSSTFDDEEFEEYISPESDDSDYPDSDIDIDIDDGDETENDEDRRAFANQKSVVELILHQSGNLRNFTALRQLNIGVKCLFGMALGISTQHSVNTKLADLLPPHLEHLCIRGYIPGNNRFYDTHIQDLFEKFVAGQLPGLTEVIGVQEFIPNSETVHMDDIDKHPELVWIDERDAII